VRARERKSKERVERDRATEKGAREEERTVAHEDANDKELERIRVMFLMLDSS
jgi:hypothetical protein